jgi:ATP-dependent RNA helicase RhlE
MQFSQFNLDPRLQAGTDRLGFQDPTPIQIEAIPLALAGHDLIGTAQTGTGKTAAFLLPILHKLLSGPRRRARALIITPTRELAEQIHETITLLKKGLDLRSATIYGGVNMNPQTRALQDGVEILVACPGRLIDHIEQGHARLDKIEFLVLDEADRMLDMGFLPSIKRIVKLLPSNRQTMLFSATFPKEIEHLAAQVLRQPKRIAIGLAKPVHTVQHALYQVPQHLKTSLLLELLKQTDTNSVLIFTRTRHRAHRLAQQIGREGYRVTSLHSDRTQGQRQNALNGFRNGTFQIMVATDIAARGLDVDSISHVINYDMPNTADDYIHRIGRTGRAERTGDAFTLATPDDHDMVRTLEKIMGQPLPRLTLSGFDYAAAAPVRHEAPAYASQQPEYPEAAGNPVGRGIRSVSKPNGRPAAGPSRPRVMFSGGARRKF